MLNLMIEEGIVNTERSWRTKAERVEIVRKLDQRGLFLIRGAVQRTAAALGVSASDLFNIVVDRELCGEASAPAVLSLLSPTRKSRHSGQQKGL